MKYRMTYNDLDVLEQSINHECQKPVFAFFLKEKVRQFRQRNAIRLNIMHDKFDELVEKYVVHNEKDEPETEKDENGNLVYRFKDENDKVAYLQELKDFSLRQIEIEI